MRLEESLRRDRIELDEELPREQAAAARSLEAGITYGQYATQLMARRERLDRSIKDIIAQVTQARDELRSAFTELKKFEQAAAAAAQRARQRTNRLDRIQEDETALNSYRREAS